MKNKINKHYLNFEVKDYLENNYSKLPKRIIDCSLGVNPFIVSKRNIKIINFKNKYPDIYYTKLKMVILRKMKKINNSLGIANISFGQGSMGIIRNIFEFLLEEGDIVLGYSPQFPRVISEIELRKSKYEYYKLEKKDNYKFFAEKFIAKISNNQKVIYIDNPNNPTGQIIEIDDIERIVKVAEKEKIFVIIDEAYGDYMREDNSAIKLINKYSNIIVIKSASKFFGMPEYRIGYMLASEDIIKIYNSISLPFPIVSMSIPFFEKQYNAEKQNSCYRKRTKYIKNRIITSINSNNLLYTNEETPILTITSSKYSNLYKELLENGIHAEDCSQYLNLNEQYARIRINNKYKKLIKILKKVL